MDANSGLETTLSYSAHLARTFASLANDDRVAIVETLFHDRATGGTGLSIADLAARLEVTRFCVSRHLGILREARLIHTTHDGRRSINTLNAEQLLHVWDWLDPLCVEAEESRPLENTAS